jgi:2,3-bisphosphoglycerate-dependent phosphoglycerate mutase
MLWHYVVKAVLMSKMRIILTRHGETDWNAGNRIQGHTDIDLNAAGEAQAEALGARLAGETIDAIYSSDLTRAARTAEPTRRRMPDVEFIMTPELRERNWGALEGLRRDEIIANFPRDAEALKSGDADFAPAGGESKNQVRARVEIFLDSLAAAHPGKTVLLVTHGGICATVLRCVLGIDMARRIPFIVDNCSMTVIDCNKDGERIVKTLNCICHLKKGD